MVDIHLPLGLEAVFHPLYDRFCILFGFSGGFGCVLPDCASALSRNDPGLLSKSDPPDR
jgi:hypothetical protein